MVAEAGQHSLAGLLIEAGKADCTHLMPEKAWQWMPFKSAFEDAPAVFTSVQTNNDADPVTTRVRNCSATGFELTMDEEEAQRNGHLLEALGWIAIAKGTGATSDNRSVKAFGASADSSARLFSFGQSFARRFPVFIADTNTVKGSDPYVIRYKNLTPSSVNLFLQEEQSADLETRHGMEELSVFVAE
jgi:hypothetical protein